MAGVRLAATAAAASAGDWNSDECFLLFLLFFPEPPDVSGSGFGGRPSPGGFLGFHPFSFLILS